MRYLPLAFVLLAACVDWNTSPTLDDLVGEFQEAEDIVDAQHCGAIAQRDCLENDDRVEPHDEAVQCFADALAACTPAVLEVRHVDGDGNETYETLVIHPEGEGACAVERFVSYPEGGRRLVKEEACEGASIPTEACEVPAADSCVEVCDQGNDTKDCG